MPPTFLFKGLHMLLLTGAAGFIGSNVLRTLNAQGISEIICVDDLTNGTKCQNLADKRFVDYIDYRQLFREIKPLHRLNGILHLGACSDTGVQNGFEICEVNYTYTKRLIRLAKRLECPMVYASSASVYGQGHSGFRELPECERPMAPYAFSKWLVDQYVRYHTDPAHRNITIPIAGVRYFNVYGPGEQHKDQMASFAYKLFSAAQQKKRVAIFEGSENFKRDFIYVQDAVDITLFLLNKQMTGIYNAGTGSPRSFADIADIAEKLAGWDARVLTPMSEEMKNRYQAYTCADTSKLRAAGYTAPFTSLEAGLTQYWQAMGGTDGTSRVQL